MLAVSVFEKPFFPLVEEGLSVLLATDGGKSTMAIQHGNPNFTKPEALGPMVSSASAFENVVAALKILPENYKNSARLRDWVIRNKDEKYVPSEILTTFGLRVNMHF